MCPEDPIVIPWKSIYIALAFFAVFLILFSLRQFLRQKKAHAVQDIEHGDSNVEQQNENIEHEPRPQHHHEADQGKKREE